MHGRAVPPAHRDLLDDFSAALAAWEWDLALLQEVPPWWPAMLSGRLGAGHRLVLTSRNALLPARRAIAVRWPDVIKSNGGGSNAVLVRGEEIVEHRTLRLRRLPERRWLQGVRLASGPWVGNLHATAHVSALAARDARLAAATLTGWAAGAPAVLGGDFNLRRPALAGFDAVARSGVDHIFVRGFVADGEAVVLDRGVLSDHAPLLVSVMKNR
jgi:endonuclease/exonuclease/phosphatase family metal-dependent hydrolase